MHHDLKLLPQFFDAKASGKKPWEIRMTDDRSFTVGDTVTFNEVDAFQLEPTGRTIGPERITYVLEGDECRGLLKGKACIFTHG